MTPAQASQWRLAVSVAKFAPDTGETTIPSGTVLAVEADRAALLAFAKLVLRGLESGAIRAQPIIDLDDDAPMVDMRPLSAKAREAIARVEGGTP